MSTRCCIHFANDKDGNGAVTVYRHCDGYPDGILPDLAQFFADVAEQCGRYETRFDDPSYLAAKFIVWQASRYAGNKWKPLAFISLGVLDPAKLPSDLEYEYRVICANGGTPTVLWRRFCEGVNPYKWMTGPEPKDEQ